MRPTVFIFDFVGVAKLTRSLQRYYKFVSRKPPEDYQSIWLLLRLWVIKSLHCACYQRRDIRLSKFVVSPPLFVAVSLVWLVTLMKCNDYFLNKSGRNRLCFAAPANETRFWQEDDKSNCTHFFNFSFAQCTCSALAAPEFFLVYFFLSIFSIYYTFLGIKWRGGGWKAHSDYLIAFVQTHTLFAIIRQPFLCLFLWRPPSPKLPFIIVSIIVLSLSCWQVFVFMCLWLQ